STSNKQVRPWRPDLNETASTKAGAIHMFKTHRDWVDFKGEVFQPDPGSEYFRVVELEFS
ncbi:hypothetical protein, partial [Pseudomonas sp. o96-267]|uniref:hypothetical protein n=1 Tax=Pseudomonas sp. o96-267 TaxID=2479853 RepID=UPI001C497ED6